MPGAGAGAGLGEGGEEGCEVELWSVSCRVLVMHGLGKLTRAVAEPACNCAYCVGLTRIYLQSLCLLTYNLVIEDVLRYLAGVPQPVPEAPVPGVPAPAAAPPLLLSTCHARQEVGKLTK